MNDAKWYDEYISIYIHGHSITTQDKGYRNIAREVAGLELMYQKGIMREWVINRLKDLAEELK